MGMSTRRAGHAGRAVATPSACRRVGVARHPLMPVASKLGLLLPNEFLPLVFRPSVVATAAFALYHDL